MLWAGEGVARVNLSVSDQGAQGQRVAFVQLLGGGTLLHPRGERRPRLSLALGAPGVNAPLVGSPHCAWKTTPVRPGFKGPTRQLQPLGGAGRRRGWCGSQKNPSHSRPALRRDGQRALKVRDRRSQLTLCRDAQLRQRHDSKAVPGPSALSRSQAATLQARCSRA